MSWLEDSSLEDCRDLSEDGCDDAASIITYHAKNLTVDILREGLETFTAFSTEEYTHFKSEVMTGLCKSGREDLVAAAEVFFKLKPGTGKYYLIPHSIRSKYKTRTEAVEAYFPTAETSSELAPSSVFGKSKGHPEPKRKNIPTRAVQETLRNLILSNDPRREVGSRDLEKYCRDLPELIDVNLPTAVVVYDVIVKTLHQALQDVDPNSPQAVSDYWFRVYDNPASLLETFHRMVQKMNDSLRL